MSAEKPYLPPRVREILTVKGCIKPKPMPAPTMPKLDDLYAFARKKQLGATVATPVPDKEAEPEDQAACATVTDGEASWEFWDMTPAVALATALADALEAREPVQATLGMAAD